MYTYSKASTSDVAQRGRTRVRADRKTRKMRICTLISGLNYTFYSVGVNDDVRLAAVVIFASLCADYLLICNSFRASSSSFVS